ncbi:lytic transglycosylase domain-containing protein [Flavicella sediminum]|uniref:lytic transglycosylase domain-containing protein n=1 Tax=Flavicella sediminum TaxID=2585141 RepID=UPI001121CD87|nr:lytic transglycosylase domain-containing protein [Flavicella sediminum]
MRKGKCLSLIFGLLVGSLHAQEAVSDSIVRNVDSLKIQELVLDSLQIQDVALDSLAKQEVLEDYSVVVDSLWLETMYSSPLFEALPVYYEGQEKEVSMADIELSTELLKERLKLLDAQTPFDLAYNPDLERLIKSYLKTRVKYYPKMMARSKYYFPMFEKYLDKYDIPLEIKYLAVVESALNPRAKSWVGATGIWQFMYQTGKQFGLNISSYVDERQDPVKSAEAACKYLESLYKTFNDWDLALAAYNSGPGNVSKAIRRSGGHRNYWNIRPFLPSETAGYLPAFYATMYIFEYAEEHNIQPVAPMTYHFATDTIQPKRLLTFDQLNETLNVSVEMLQFLNPEYKLDIVPFVKDRNYTIRLPKEHIGTFVENEAAIYELAAKEEAAREKPLPQYFEMSQRIRYTVKSGDYLGKIANRYGVRVSDIKKWNSMRTSNISIGKRLTIYPKRLNFTVAKTSSSTKSKKPVAGKGEKISYTVKKGDSLWSISKKYPKITIQELKDWNGIGDRGNIVPGKKLYIYQKSL